MSERYSRVFTLPPDQYAEGSSVVISAGALLKDNQTGSILAQLKMINTSSKKVKAVSVKVDCYDTAHEPLGEPVLFEYLDLDIKRDDPFGAKTPIPIPNASTRVFEAQVTRIVFEDQSIQTVDATQWKTLPTLKRLEDALGAELASQYKRDVSHSAVYEPTACDGFWACTCGSLNQDDDEHCHICKLEKEKQFLALDHDTLLANQVAFEEAEAKKKAEAEAARLERVRKAEAERAERERQEELARQEAKKRAKRNTKIALLTLGSLAICAALVLLWLFVLSPMLKYNQAQKQFDQGNFDEAIVIFEELEDYKDSPEKVLEAKYAKADKLFAGGDFDAAEILFYELNDYNDASARLRETLYAKADKLFADGDYDAAASQFGLLGDYNDASSRLMETQYAKADKLFTDEDFAAAEALFIMLGDYSDSPARLRETQYAKAGALLKSEDYFAAAEIYGELSKYYNYKDSEKLYFETTISYAAVLIKEKDFSEAITQLKPFRSIDEANALLLDVVDRSYAEGEYDAALSAYELTKDYSTDSEQYKDLKYKIAESLLAKKEYQKAKDAYRSIKGYLDADQKMQECEYQKALSYLSEGLNSSAVDSFAKIKTYKDSQQKMYDAMYKYATTVTLNNNTSETVAKYLKELMAVGYKDSASVYKELFSWKAEIIANNSETDTKTNMSSISKYDTWYFHVTLKGGEPKANTKLSYILTYPDGDTKTNAWSGTWGEGYSGWASAWYNTPAYGDTGTLKIQVYDGNWNLIGEHSVRITG